MSDREQGSKTDHAAHYEALLAEHARSGQTLRAFARSRGMSEWTLYEWRRKLARARPAAFRSVPTCAKRGRLVEVTLSAPPSPPSPPRSSPATRDRSPSGLVVHLFGTHRVELPADFRESDVRRLMSALTPEERMC